MGKPAASAFLVKVFPRFSGFTTRFVANFRLAGDFFLEPDSALEAIDAAVNGLPIDSDPAAIAGFLLGNAYYYIHIAGVGALMGVLTMAFGAAAVGGYIEWGSGIASAILGAMLACRFERPVVIFATSLIGGATFFGAAKSLGVRMPTAGAVLLMVAITALGCVVQAKTTRKPTAKTAGPRVS